MSDETQGPKRLREDHPAREELREKLNRYLDLPLALASVVVALLIVLQLVGDLEEPWRGRVETLGWALWAVFFVEFAVKFALAPVKRTYLRRNWLDLLIVLLPFLRFLRLARVLRATRALPVFRLLVLGGRGSSSALVLLKRRRLGQLAVTSAMIILIGAALGFLLESRVTGTQMVTFGDAIWWASTTVTTVGSDIQPVTPVGRVLAFLLMVYGLGVFSYFVASIASVLVGLDTRQDESERAAQRSKEQGLQLEDRELETLRSILKRAERP